MLECCNAYFFEEVISVMFNNSDFFNGTNLNSGFLNQNVSTAGENSINNSRNVVPNRTHGSSTEYDKSNNKIMKFPVEKFAGIEIKTLTQNPQKRVLKEKTDGIPIDYILQHTDMKLDKDKAYLTLNKRLRQLANEIPTEVSNYENDKQTFYKNQLFKNKVLKFMPVSFDRLITSINSSVLSIKDVTVQRCFQDCLNQYAQKVKNVSQNFDNMLNDIKVNSGDIADKLGDSAMIH